MHCTSIVGIGSYLPRLMHDNDTLPPLEKPLEPSELERIGVLRRGWAGEGESVAEMGAEAAREALSRAELSADQIDAIVLSNWTQRRYIPEHAPLLQHLLGAHRAIAFDVSCACAGFVYGLAIAQGLLHNPRFSRALVVASETTSRRARPGSKATVILGDAAGAFVLERDTARGARLIDIELATDGALHSIMDISSEGYVRTHIAQGELNELAGRSIAAVASKLLARNRMNVDDLAWVIPHSGTAGVQKQVARALGVSPEKILTNFAEIGNVSSASIPAALEHFVSVGRVRRGDLVLSAAVGTGWYSAAMLYQL